MLKSLSNESITKKIEYVKCDIKVILTFISWLLNFRCLKLYVRMKTFMCFGDVRHICKIATLRILVCFPTVINTNKLVAVNPATSATAERTFSSARNLKTWLQSTMLPARFNFLALLKFQKE